MNHSLREPPHKRTQIGEDYELARALITHEFVFNMDSMIVVKIYMDINSMKSLFSVYSPALDLYMSATILSICNNIKWHSYNLL